jgi:hypothetical protein
MTFPGPFLISALLFAFVACCPAALAEEENYCRDQESWQEWEDLASKYADDVDIQALHALRIGLCVKVERGDLTLEQATDIFERARDSIIRKKESESDSKRKLEL